MGTRLVIALVALGLLGCVSDMSESGTTSDPDPVDIDIADDPVRDLVGDDGDETDPIVPMIFDANRLLEDDQILGGVAITTDDVQRFLDDQGSFLATYNDPTSGASAASVIVERSRAYGVNPLYMLARIQTESSLVSSGTSNNLDAATGCGCPDDLGCNPELGGFGNQIECAASKMRGYYDDLDAGDSTIAGWNVDEAHDTLDPCAIVPTNKATAALYTYTPWVGAYAEQCGRSTVGGSSLVALVYFRFWLDSDFDWPSI